MAAYDKGINSRVNDLDMLKCSGLISKMVKFCVLICKSISSLFSFFRSSYKMKSCFFRHGQWQTLLINCIFKCIFINVHIWDLSPNVTGDNFSCHSMSHCQSTLSLPYGGMRQYHDGVIKWTHFTGEFPAQRPVTRSFGVFFDLRQNKPYSKQWWGWWFETPSSPLWRHCNDIAITLSMQSRFGWWHNFE